MRVTKTPVVATVLAFGAFIAGTQEAGAVLVSCPGTVATADREFALDTAVASVCTHYGNGPFQTGGGHDYLDSSGWTLIDKFEAGAGDNSGVLNGALTIGGIGSLSGSFSINAAVWSMFDSIVFTMQSGIAMRNPDWVIFTLASDTTGGTWNITPEQAGALSNATIYGRGAPTQVPEPASAALLGIGLLGLAIARRRRAAR